MESLTRSLFVCIALLGFAITNIHEAEANSDLLLVCTLFTGGEYKGEATMLVKFDSKTVNGLPAVITQNKINFKIDGIPWSIDRISGGIVATSPNINLITGNCRKSTGRKF